MTSASSLDALACLKQLEFVNKASQSESRWTNLSSGIEQFSEQSRQENSQNH